MRKVVIAMLAVGALAALGCDDKKPDAKPGTTAAPAAKPTAAATAAPAKTGSPGGGW